MRFTKMVITFFAMIAICNGDQKSLKATLITKEVRGKVGDEIKIFIQIENLNEDSRFIHNIVRTGNGIRLNGATIRTDGTISTSHLSGSWQKGENPHKPLEIKPSQKHKTYVKWKIKKEEDIVIDLGSKYEFKDSTVIIKLL